MNIFEQMDRITELTRSSFKPKPITKTVIEIKEISRTYRIPVGTNSLNIVLKDDTDEWLARQENLLMGD